VLSGFADDVDRFRYVKTFAGDANGGVDFRNLTFGELTVDRRPSDLDDVPIISVAVAIFESF